MQIKEGYKQTEVGVIPSDWIVRKLEKGLIVNPDYGINAAAVDYKDDLPRYLRITDISESGRFLQTHKASVSHKLAKLYYLDEGDIVFARTGASVGKTYLHDPNDGKLVFAGFLIRIKLNLSVLDPRYIFFYTQTNNYWSWVISNSMRSGQPGLNSNQIKSLLIPLPPTLEEQTAIATALSDMDELIKSMEQLIEKKKAIKQGAMQQLLKPKEGWVVKKLGEVGEFKNGINKSAENFGFGYPFVNLMDVFGISKISKNDHLGLINSTDEERNSYDLKEGDVLFIRSSVKPEGVGLTCVIEKNLPQTVYSGFIIRFRDNGTFSNAFKEFCFSSQHFRNRVIANSSVSANTNINQEALKNLILQFPKSKEEQSNIGNILSDMDKEIASLEANLTKYKSIKQGMMQELLTGKTRLI